jgi:hypothetical protein
MSKRTLFLIFALFLITFVLLIIALGQPNTPAYKITPTITAPQEPVAQTILSFEKPIIATSSSVSILNYSLPIDISTGENKVTTIQLELQYDPDVLIDVVATSGSFFANPTVFIDKIDLKAGRISYAIGVNPKEKGVSGEGIVANLTFSVKNTRNIRKTSIEFLPKTFATINDTGKSVLKKASIGEFTVGIDASNLASPSAK